MEKFGIFELLDALSAIALDAGKGDADRPPEDDPVYRPPVYDKTNGAETTDKKQEEGGPHTQKAGNYAISDFYKRHNERSGK